VWEMREAEEVRGGGGGRDTVHIRAGGYVE
jgi:hypothetical protein